MFEHAHKPDGRSRPCHRKWHRHRGGRLDGWRNDGIRQRVRWVHDGVGWFDRRGHDRIGWRDER